MERIRFYRITIAARFTPVAAGHSPAPFARESLGRIRARIKLEDPFPLDSRQTNVRMFRRNLGWRRRPLERRPSLPEPTRIDDPPTRPSTMRFLPRTDRPVPSGRWTEESKGPGSPVALGWQRGAGRSARPAGRAPGFRRDRVPVCRQT